MIKVYINGEEQELPESTPMAEIIDKMYVGIAMAVKYGYNAQLDKAEIRNLNDLQLMCRRNDIDAISELSLSFRIALKEVVRKSKLSIPNPNGMSLGRFLSNWYATFSNITHPSRCLDFIYSPLHHHPTNA